MTATSRNTMILYLVLGILLLAGTTAEPAAHEQRHLLATDWSVQIPDTVTGLSFDFDTGDGDGSGEIKVEIFDLCPAIDSGTPTSEGFFYPTSTVTGITVDDSGVVNDPGSGNTIDFSFDFPGIDSNTNLYTDNNDDTATVVFCAQVGLYKSNDLESMAQVKLIYDIDLTDNSTTLNDYYLAQTHSHVSIASSAVTFDGTLQAYFCNPTTHVQLSNDGTTTYQGSILDVCFRVPDGQFEVTNVLDLVVFNNDAGTSYLPTQTLVANGVVQTGTGATPYAVEACTDVDGDDTNVCVLSFLLQNDFFDKPDLFLSGSGTVVLELGDATGSRRRRRTTAGFYVGDQETPAANLLRGTTPSSSSQVVGTKNMTKIPFQLGGAGAGIHTQPHNAQRDFLLEPTHFVMVQADDHDQVGSANVPASVPQSSGRTTTTSSSLGVLMAVALTSAWFFEL